MKMKVSIDLVKPNPFRDFEIDPFDTDQIGNLVSSINQLGQFGAVPVRPHPHEKGAYQQASGHHTVEALRQSGAKEVNIECKERSDDEMALLMGVENLTQRTNSTGAIADAVAAQAYLVAVSNLLLPSIGQQNKGRGKTTAELQFLNSGPGRDAILDRLRDPSGGNYLISKANVTSALQTLKATGKMAEIMQKAFDAVEAQRKARAEAEAKRIAAIENEEARKQAEEAEKERLKQDEADAEKERQARQKQAELEVAYDVNCIHMFKVQQQEQAFRQVVLSGNGRCFIPKHMQVPLAEEVLAEIAEVEAKRGQTMGSNTVKELVNNRLREAMKMQREIDEQERQENLRNNDAARIKKRWSDVRRGLQNAEAALMKLAEEERGWSYDDPFPVDMDAVAKLRGIGKRFDDLAKKLTGI